MFSGSARRAKDSPQMNADKQDVMFVGFLLHTKIPRENFHGGFRFKTQKIYCFGRLKVFTIKTAMLARVTASSGQNLPLPQPVEIPSAASCLIHAAAQ